VAGPSKAEGALSPRLRRLLRDTFGIPSLREGQQAVIERVLAGRNTLAVMPTGAGKSLCYQLPAVALGGRTVVVSPLIALMKDQCDKLSALGLAAVSVHAALPADALDAALAAVGDGSATFVFVTPERLADPDFRRLLASQPTELLVVDEAHCIAQWGHDFRPAFLDIGLARKSLGRPTVLALTATASPDTVAEVCEQLGIPADGVLSSGTWRENLHYRVEHLGDDAGRLDRVLALVAASEGSGLVYTATIKAAEDVARALELAGESARCYHGQMAAADRHEVQDAYMAGRLRVVVATNAFGLGIDKPDTRFVVHYQMPGSLDAYYQESGRAGRDGHAADCTLLFLRGDKSVQQFFLAGRYPAAADLEAIYQALREDAPDGWTAEALADRLRRPRTKVKAVLSLLKQGRVLASDRAGRLRLVRPDLVAGELMDLQARYVRKREQAQDTLERMVAYALTGRCRWRTLLEHFGEAAPFEGCGTCDNCVRLAGVSRAADEAIQAAEVAPLPAAVSFDVGAAVKVRRYGAGTVVTTAGGSVTVAFPEGRQREFLAEFVTRVAPRRARSAPKAEVRDVPTTVE